MSIISFQKYRKFSFVIIVLLIVLFLIRDVNAANQAEIKVSTEPGGLFYKITETESLSTITFHLSEESGEHSAPIMFFTDGLKGESTTRIIDPDFISITYGEDKDSTIELLKRNDLVKITIIIDTQNVGPDVYTGKLTIRSTNATNVEVPIKVEVSQPQWVPASLNLAGVVLGVVFTVLGIVLPKIRKRDKKTTTRLQAATRNASTQWKSIVAFLGIIVVLFFFTYIAYYPKIIAFGANSVYDYGMAFIFGFAQVGASKITADALKSE